MIVTQTDRGFDLIEFVDMYGLACSLQKSSLATEDAVWLEATTPTTAGRSARMHLTQNMVRELLPHLVRFVETGEIRLPVLRGDDDEDFRDRDPMER